ncbi:hypothetical protein SAMN02745127_03110 [Oceanospirillum multiglobuliferum]|uniref:Uncharacterized protein n=2 Tax=Oceanospirillum multiglobuliferum TaxID=64969 RepID=A0A1T4SIX0_9GAMM|nr:hypothetical protein BTE48_15730 [Oceanospirillum multiglobuliferum]SKA28105.1 hypothetical protein SAMN02745127_03110 [Oceanospirillum multiglobuliferum]
MRASIERRLRMCEKIALSQKNMPDRSKLNPERVAQIADYLVSDVMISMDELKPMLRAAYDD